MKDILTLLALGFSFLLVSCNDGSEEASEGGGKEPETVADDTAEKLVTDTEQLFTKITSAIKEVNEGADPEMAAAKIEQWKGEAQKFSERVKTIVKDDFDGNREAFEEKMKELAEDGMGETMKEFSIEMTKIAQEGKEGSQEFLEEMQSVLSELN